MDKELPTKGHGASGNRPRHTATHGGKVRRRPQQTRPTTPFPSDRTAKTHLNICVLSKFRFATVRKFNIILTFANAKTMIRFANGK